MWQSLTAFYAIFAEKLNVKANSSSSLAFIELAGSSPFLQK